jgi:Ca2+-binding EF-hand superfamily protein
MRRRSSRLKGRGREVTDFVISVYLTRYFPFVQHASNKLIESFLHMIQVLIRRGLNFDEMLRRYDEVGNGVIEKDHFVKSLVHLGLPFDSKGLSVICQRYAISGVHLDYEAILQDAYSGNNAAAAYTGSDDSLEAGDGVSGAADGSILTILVELRRMLKDAVLRTNKSFDDIYRMFSRWDVGGTGTVTATQFLRVLAHLHINFSDHDQDFLVELFDTNGEGRVDFDSLISFCIRRDNNHEMANGQIAEQSPYMKSAATGDDFTYNTSNSALSVGSGGSVDQQPAPLGVGEVSPPLLSPGKGSTARAAPSFTFQNGRPRPRTATGGGRSSYSSDLNGSSKFQEHGGDSSVDGHRYDSILTDANSYNSAGQPIESPSSVKRSHKHMTRPLTAAPRIPETVSVPRQTDAQRREAAAVLDDEFVVDVLSDDDVIDDDYIAVGNRHAPSGNGDAGPVAGDPSHRPVDKQVTFHPAVNCTTANSAERDGRDKQLFVSAALAPHTGGYLNPMYSVPQQPVHYNSAVTGQGASYGAAQMPPIAVETRPRDSTQPLPGGSNGASGLFHQFHPENPYADERKLHPMGGPYAHHQERAHVSSQPPAAALVQVANRGSMPPPQSFVQLQYPQHSSGNDSARRSVANLSPPAAALKMLRREIIARHQHSGKSLLEIFRRFDLVGNRYFGEKDLQRGAAELSIVVDDDLAREMLRLLALDGEGRVSFAEFAVYITDPDFPSLTDRVQRLVAEQYERQGREYQLKLYNTLMQSGPNSDPQNAAQISGLISKAKFETALSDLGLVLNGSGKNTGSPLPMLSNVEVSRLTVRFDTHGRDLCSVAKFLRMIQNCDYWKEAEKRVSLMEEAAEEAQTAREELAYLASTTGEQGAVAGILLSEELIDMAEYLGIRVLSEPYLLWIVDAAVRAPVPEGWSIHTDKKGRNFFFNRQLGTSQWDHPLDSDFRRLRDEYRVIYLAQRQLLYQSNEDINARRIDQPRVSEHQRDMNTFSKRDADFGGRERDPRKLREIPAQVVHSSSLQAPQKPGIVQSASTPVLSSAHPHTPFAHPAGHQQAQTPSGESVAAAEMLRIMRGIEPAELMRALNSGTSLLGIMQAHGGTSVLTQENDTIHAQLAPLQNSPNRTPGLLMHSRSAGAAIVLSASSGPRSSSPSKRSTAQRKGQEKVFPRRNGSGMFDPTRADRERLEAKRFHNYDQPSAVERAVAVGKERLMAPLASAGHMEQSSQKTGYQAADGDEPSAQKTVERRELGAGHRSGAPAVTSSESKPRSERPRSGSAVRTASGYEDRQRPKSSNKAGRSQAQSAAVNSYSREHERSSDLMIPSEDMFGERLLSRLDKIAANDHSMH